MKFMLYLGSAIAAVSLFFSGSLPYTLINDQESLHGVAYVGEEPIAAETVKCKIDDANSLMRGATFKTAFRVKLRNNTNRFVVISTIGEVFDPSGHSLDVNAQMFVLNPNSSEETRFQSNATFTTNGNYSCDMRYTVGRFKH